MMPTRTAHRGGARFRAAGLLAVCVYGATGFGRPPVHAQVLDRIVAVVDGVPITQSDVSAAVRLGLAPGSPAADPVSAVLDRLIERHLMLAEVERYAPPEPPESEVDRRVAEIQGRAGPELEKVLQQTGLTFDQLRRHVRDDLRIEAYLQQRFGTIVPSEQDILQYYREHAAEFQGSSFDEAHDRVRSLLVAERRTSTIRDWVAGLRRRANINVLPH
jgi:parvulin-like peptidyl-prolyl isomerase